MCPLCLVVDFRGDTLTFNAPCQKEMFSDRGWLLCAMHVVTTSGGQGGWVGPGVRIVLPERGEGSNA